MPHSAIRTDGSCWSTPSAIGWAASGRNGGFVDASLTHGLENGKSRWPNEIETARGDGAGQPGRHAGRYRAARAWTSTGSAPACCRSPPNRIRSTGCSEAADDGAGPVPRRRRGARRGGVADLPGRPVQPPTPCAIVHPAKLAFELARACAEAGVQIFEHTNVTVDRRSGAASGSTAGDGTRSPPTRRCWPPTSFRACCGATGCTPCPVYDYVLATEPLTDAQLDRIGWREQTGNRRLRQPVSLLPAVSADNRIVWGGYDAVYHFGRKVDADVRGPARPPTAGSPRTSSSPSRNSTTSGSATGGPGRSTPTPGSARTGGWPARAGSPTSTASPGSASARRGSPPTSAWTCSTGQPTERTELEMVRKRAAAVSA